MNRISVPIHIANPKLWYPLGYGAQDRYRFAATVRIGRDVAADASLKTGLRSIELRREVTKTGKSFEFVVNGIPVFAKGADVIPFDSFPNRVTPEIHRQILEAARDAHMNMVREWGGGYYESDDFYDICDELGIMVWQEFIFGGDMVPGGVDFQNNVKQEAIEQVERLRDHPSIVLWCGNNEIETGWVHWGDRQIFKESVSPADREKVWTDYVVLFHGILASVVAHYADPVPYWASSPSANFEDPPDSQTNGDMHYWQVWHALAPIEMYTQQFPRFMSEYGFQSFPEMRTIRSFAQPGDMDIHSATMQDHQKNHGGNERILSYMLRWYPEPKDFASFVYLSQVLQAEAIKVGAEHLRRQMPNTMGSLYWQLNDCWPVASWASIDYYGRWKALQYYARRFYDDLLVSPFAHDGKVDVYVVSDKLQPLSGQIHWRLLDFSGKVLMEKTQDVQIPAQSSAVYFTLDQKELLGERRPEKEFSGVRSGGRRTKCVAKSDFLRHHAQSRSAHARAYREVAGNFEWNVRADASVARTCAQRLHIVRRSGRADCGQLFRFAAGRAGHRETQNAGFGFTRSADQLDASDITCRRVSGRSDDALARREIFASAKAIYYLPKSRPTSRPPPRA